MTVGNDEEDVDHHAFDLFSSTDNIENECSEITYDFVNVGSNELHTVRLRFHEDYTQSTGLSIWKGAEVLCDYLRNHAKELFANKNPEGNNKGNKEQKVLELGAGVGLCSLAAHSLGAERVVATDGDATVLENLKQNIDMNRVDLDRNIVCQQLIWGHSTQMKSILETHGPFDIVLAADVCYMTKSLVPLLSTAHALMKDDGVLILVHQSYSQEVDFHETIVTLGESQGFACECQRDEPEVYMFRKKQSVP